MTAAEMKIGTHCNWRNQSERLVYLGKKLYPGDRRTWHRFAKVDALDKVWCEVLDADLHMIEKTAPGATK